MVQQSCYIAGKETDPFVPVFSGSREGVSPPPVFKERKTERKEQNAIRNDGPPCIILKTCFVFLIKVWYL